MRTGKLPPELLRRLLARIPRTDPRVLLGSSVGEDAAALDFMAPPMPDVDAGGGAPSERILIAKTDPVTFATDKAGWYAVHVNANDVACSGATPRWFLASALLPESWDEPRIEGLFDQILEACRSLGVSLVGGHTEVTGGIDRPLIAGTMLGEVDRARQVRTGGARPGDALILTQGMAIEGTAVLAREMDGRLRARGVGQDLVSRAQRLLFEPGISVVAAARALCDAARAPDGVHSLHDPTEGGLATGIRELLEASGLCGTIEADAVPLLAETRAVCDALGLDPWGLLASGALLAAVSPSATPAAVGALREMGVPAQVIGTVTPVENGIVVVQPDGTRGPLRVFDRDEVARYFAEAG